ncbi:hypothetical protein M413DRAFT_176175 [Hebeloma cylindrosporum]|uniref:Uncharacterized protein n=1 Tax=Hebeloma cylindrosporum TaxID=76867 RepID=A0A0C3C7U2_HEBCY|nr:hypothetical protein M413DRAFT_176175 [Hebeloma cylindrosporum h7]
MVSSFRSDSRDGQTPERVTMAGFEEFALSGLEINVSNYRRESGDDGGGRGSPLLRNGLKAKML